MKVPQSPPPFAFMTPLGVKPTAEPKTETTEKRPSLTERSIVLAEKTADAYSFDAYKSWRGVARYLLGRGFSEMEAEAILRSKWMRWAGDASKAHKYGSYNSTDIARFIDKMEPARMKREVAELVAGTFPNR